MAMNVTERLYTLSDVIDLLVAQSAAVAADQSLDPRHDITDRVYIAGKQAALADAIAAIAGMIDPLWILAAAHKDEHA